MQILLPFELMIKLFSLPQISIDTLFSFCFWPIIYPITYSKFCVFFVISFSIIIKSIFLSMYSGIFET